VTVTDANGCSRDIDDIEITEPAEEVQVSANGEDITCFGENDGAITVSASGYERLELWRNGALVPGAVLTGDTYTGLISGTYVVKAYATGGNGEEDACKDESDPIAIDEPNDLEVTLQADNILCFEGSTNINLTVIGG